MQLLGRPHLTRWEYKRAGGLYYEGGAGSSRWECLLTAASETVSLRTPTTRSELLGWLDMARREGKWHARMYGETDGETCYNLEGEPVTGDVATNLMLESIAEGENGGVGWPYKDCQDVTADVIEWVMHEVGERMGFTGRNNTFRGAGHNGKTLSEKIGIFDAWSLAVLPAGVLDSLMVGSDAATDDSGAPGMLDDSALSMLTAAAAAGMQQKGAGRGGQGGQAQPNKRPHAEDVSRGSAKRATTSAEAAGVVQQPAAGQQEQEEEEDFVQKYEIEQLVTLALLEENMRDQHDRITVEWMAAFAGTHMAVYTYRKKQLTPAELSHLAELFWVNACFD